MAGKARRAAARQGELSRKRKRGQRGPSGLSPNAPQPTQAQPANGGTPALAVEAAGSVAATAAVEAEPAATPSPAPQPVARSRTPGRQRGERPAADNYVGSELRRIGVLATVAVAALVALSFVL